MYPLESNPTLAQIVARSAACHPSSLKEALRAGAAGDRAALRGVLPRRAQDVVLARAKYCVLALRAVELFGDGDREALGLMGLGPLLIAANIAARFQCLPRHIVTDAAIRAGEEREAKEVEART